MAFGRSGGTMVSTPRTLTVAVSLALVALVLLSFTAYLPASLAVVKAHRTALLFGGYGVLLAGVLLRRL